MPARLDKYAGRTARGKSVSSVGRGSSQLEATLRPLTEACSRHSLATSRVSPTPEPRVKSRQQPRRPVVPVVRTTLAIPPSDKKDEKGSVAPSLNSAFRYVPTYFKPDILRKFKFDADLVTALAKATECRQKGQRVMRNRLSGSEMTDTAVSSSTAAATSRTARTDLNGIGGVNV